MDPIFDALARFDLDKTEEIHRRVRNLSVARLLEIDGSLAQTVGAHWLAGEENEFCLLPNDDLAGGVLTSCWAGECRLRNIDYSARLAAMWADRMYLPPYFGVIEGETEEESMIRGWIASSIVAVLEMRPLIDAGIVRITPNAFYYCSKHGKEYERDRDRAESIVAKAAEVTLETYLPKFKVFVTTSFRPDLCYVGLEGPEEISPHDVGYVTSWKKAGLPISIHGRALRNPRQPVPLSKDIVRGSGVLNTMFERISAEIVGKHLLSNRVGAKYITSRAGDSVFIEELNANDYVARWNDLLLKFLTYEMPIITSVPLADLLEIRRHDGEAFEVYRDTIKDIFATRISGRPPVSESEASEMFNDVVRPQLNKMNQKLASIQDQYDRKMGRSIKLLGSTLGIGLLAGTASLGLGGILTALLASKPAQDLVTGWMEKRDSPSALSGDSLYFLWRVHRAATAT